MAQIDGKLMCEKVRPLEKGSIPHLNPMEWKMRMSGNTTATAPNVRSKAIPTPICAGGLLTM